MVRRHGLEHPRGIVGRRVTEFVKVWKSPEDFQSEEIGVSVKT